jgi:hypothetical protein
MFKGAKLFHCALVLSLAVTYSFGQTAIDPNLAFWSPTSPLTVDDFAIKTKNGESHSSFAQFSVDYQVGGFDFMAKNLNKRVRNYIIRSASSIDTTYDIAASLRYQQTLFDLCEIYTRHFRKALKENKKKLASGGQFINGLNQQAMTDFTNRRVAYDRETNFGNLADKQLEWEQVIEKELDELVEYSVN